LIQFDSLDFDIILEMSSLCTYGFKIDCEDLKVTSRFEQGRKLCFIGEDKKNVIL